MLERLLSRKENRMRLSQEKLNKLKFINQTSPKSSLSEEYSFLSTCRVITMVESAGWFVASAEGIGVRNLENNGFQKHVVRFNSPDHDSIMKEGEVRGQAVMYNSHDGSCRYKFLLGALRCVCDNQMTVSHGTFPAIEVKHRSLDEEEVFRAIGKVVSALPLLETRISEMNSIQLTPAEQEAFSRKAAQLRFLEEPKMDDRYNLEYIQALLKPNRPADEGSSLWKVFNRIQEKILNGGAYRHRLDSNGNLRGGITRKIKSISSSVNLNQALWALAESTAKEVKI